MIRRGANGDRPFVADLGKRTLATSVSAQRDDAVPAMVEASYERMLAVVYDQSHVLLIAERDGAPLGFLLLLDRLPDQVTGVPQGFIAYMAVEPAVRGHGIGSALLAAAEDEARRRGLPYMTLMVTEENEAARAVYKTAGYHTERRLLCKKL